MGLSATLAFAITKLRSEGEGMRVVWRGWVVFGEFCLGDGLKRGFLIFGGVLKNF